MGQWMLAWLGYWQALYVRGAALVVCLALGLAGAMLIGAPILLLPAALGADGKLGLLLVVITIFPIVAGTMLGVFQSDEAPRRPPSWTAYKLGVPLPGRQRP